MSGQTLTNGEGITLHLVQSILTATHYVQEIIVDYLLHSRDLIGKDLKFLLDLIAGGLFIKFLINIKVNYNKDKIKVLGKVNTTKYLYINIGNTSIYFI